MDKFLIMRTSELGLSDYICNCLNRHGVCNVEQLIQLTEQDLLGIKGIYERQCADIVKAMAVIGISPAKNDEKNYDAGGALLYPRNLICDVLGSIEEDIPVDLDHMMGLAAALARLSEQEQDILSLRYKHLYTLEKIGDRYHITKEQVRQIIRASLRKLRHPSYSRLIIKGLNGYIEYRVKIAETEIESKMETLLREEYMRGYRHGLENSGKQGMLT